MNLFGAIEWIEVSVPRSGLTDARLHQELRPLYNIIPRNEVQSADLLDQKLVTLNCIDGINCHQYFAQEGSFIMSAYVGIREGTSETDAKAAKDNVSDLLQGAPVEIGAKRPGVNTDIPKAASPLRGGPSQ